jgi:hypothetical protein
VDRFQFAHYRVHLWELYEQDNEPSCSMKEAELLCYLSNYESLRKYMLHEVIRLVGEVDMCVSILTGYV